MSGREPPDRRPHSTTLRWTIHPAADNPTRAALVLAAVVVGALLAARVMGSTAVGVAAALMLLISLRAYFLPRTYVLDAQGARELGLLSGGRAMPWTDVRKVDRVRFGVHLSPRLSDSRLLPDRGLFLRTAGNAAEVTAFAETAKADS